MTGYQSQRMVPSKLVCTKIIFAFLETVLKRKAHNEKRSAIINQNLPITFFFLSLQQQSNAGEAEPQLNGLKIACR